MFTFILTGFFAFLFIVGLIMFLRGMSIDSEEGMIIGSLMGGLGLIGVVVMLIILAATSGDDPYAVPQSVRDKAADRCLPYGVKRIYKIKDSTNTEPSDYVFACGKDQIMRIASEEDF